MHITRTIIVNRPPEDVYLFWQDYENFSLFMHHLDSISKTGDRLLHWKAKPVQGVSAEWYMEIELEIPHSHIAWKSLKGSSSEVSGSVRFERATGGRGTLVRMEVDYDASALGAAISKLFSEDPGQHLAQALRLSKQILETGAISISEASIIPGHPAQPPSDDELGRRPSVRGYIKDYPSAAERQ